MRRVIFLIFSSILLFGSDSNLTYVPFEEAIARVKDEHKIIMLKLISQKCHFCREMDRVVLKDRDVIEALNRDFISVSLDVNRDRLPLGLKKGVTPTFAFVNMEGELFSVFHGAWNRADFLDLLKYIKKKSKVKREPKR